MLITTGGSKWMPQCGASKSRHPNAKSGAAATGALRWADFEVGDRSENTFQRRYARLPGSDLYRIDAYAVY